MQLVARTYELPKYGFIFQVPKFHLKLSEFWNNRKHNELIQHSNSLQCRWLGNDQNLNGCQWMLFSSTVKMALILDILISDVSLDNIYNWLSINSTSPVIHKNLQLSFL